MDALTIGAAARESGVGVETIRFYERRRLIRQPAKPPGVGRRRYAPAIVARIRFIRQAQAIGFTLQEIAGLLALRVAPGTDCAAVRARATAKLASVDARLAELGRIRAALAKLVAMCPGSGAVARCTILDALDSAAEVRSVPAARRAGQRKQGGKDMKSLELKIEGMHCDGCASTIEALLVREPGVKGASVTYAAGKGQILYDPAATDPLRIAATIEQAGYHVADDPVPGRP